VCGAQIERLWQQSNGGFGAYLLLAHNWANPQATLRSYELIAREVMRAAAVMDPALLIASKRAIFPGPIRPPLSKSMRIETWVSAVGKLPQLWIPRLNKY
jgi:hypothetical protein